MTERQEILEEVRRYTTCASEAAPFVSGEICIPVGGKVVGAEEAGLLADTIAGFVGTEGAA